VVAGCRNSSNPYHNCSDYCSQYITSMASENGEADRSRLVPVSSIGLNLKPSEAQRVHGMISAFDRVEISSANSSRSANE
jgi:hypothetical protein